MPDDVIEDNVAPGASGIKQVETEGLLGLPSRIRAGIADKSRQLGEAVSDITNPVKDTVGKAVSAVSSTAREAYSGQEIRPTLAPDIPLAEDPILSINNHAGRSGITQVQGDFFTEVGQSIQDFGFGSTVKNMVDDALVIDERDENFHVLQSGVNKLIEKYDFPDEFVDDIYENASNLEEAEDYLLRVKRMIDRSGAREARSIPMSLLVEGTAFVADPTNLIPGLVLLKGAAMPAKVAAYQAMKQKLLSTTTGKAATVAAFGAAEEAIRSAPRLASDPTFEFDEYLTYVGMGAILGGGIVGGIPLGKFTVNKTMQGISSALNKTAQSVADNYTIQTGVSIVETAAKHAKTSTKPLRPETYKDTLNTARVQARERVEQSAIVRDIRATTDKFQSIKDTATQAGDSIKDFVDVMKNIVRRATPEANLKGKLDEIIQKMETRVAAVDKPVQTSKPDTGPKSGGAAARKESFETGQGDVEADLRNTFKSRKKTAQQQMDEIANIEKEVLDELDALPSTPGREAAKQGAKAAGQAARDSIEAKLAREGIQVERRRATAERAHEASIASVRKAGSNQSVKAMNKLLKKLNLPATAGLGHVYRSIANRLELIGIKNDDLATGIVNWINKEPKLAQQRAMHVRDIITQEHKKAYEELEIHYNGNPADKDFLQAKAALLESRNKMESVADWIGMLNSKRYADLVEIEPRWAILSQEYQEGMGEEARRLMHAQYDSMSQWVISKQFGTLTESLTSQLIRTKVPLAEWMAMNILEAPAGYAGKIERKQTAAILSQIYEAEIQHPLNKAWFDMMDSAAKHQGKGMFGRLLLRTQGANTSKAVRDVSRKVMREMNRRQIEGNAIGKGTFVEPYITKFADALEEANQKAYNLQLRHGVDGITGNNQMKSYMKQTWNDGALMAMLQNPSVGKEGAIELIGSSLHLRSQGRMSKKAAENLATAVINTKLAVINRPQVDSSHLRSENLANSMASIDELIESMNRNGQQDSIEEVLSYIKDNETGMPGYAHKRFLNLDYSASITRDGETISIMDLLDNDVIGVANRYNKEAAGRSAIAEASGGLLRSDADIEGFIGALGMQASEMGSHGMTKETRNVFRQIMGLPFDGALPMDIRKIRDAVALSGMNGLGESQLAELGLSINRGLAGLLATAHLGRKSLGQVKDFMGMKLTPEQAASTKFLGELQEFSRLYEDMHALARNNVHFDMRENQNAQSLMNKVVETATGGKYRPTLQYLQTRNTGYSAIRTAEEQIAMAGLMQDAIGFIRGDGAFTSEARFKDIGLDIDLIRRKLDDGSIVLNDKGRIETLGMQTWSQADNYNLSVALRRHAGQQVQIGFAGEMSPHMMNPQVAFLMQFKSYPMLAAEKQMGRSAKFGDKEAAMGIVLNAASSSGARLVRYHSLAAALPVEDRERYVERKLERDFARDTVAYMGIVGMMVNSTEMVRDVGFGNSSVASQIPVVNWADNYRKALQAAGKGTDMTERDIGIILRAAPLGTIGDVNIIAGVVRTAMDTGSKFSDEPPEELPFVRQSQNRGN